MTSVLIVDDHQLLREALCRALEDAGFVVIGEADNGQEAVDLAASLHPDVILIDVGMPVLDGIAAMRRMHSASPATPVVVLTMHTEERVRLAAVEAGAAAFLTTSCSMRDVVAAVSAAAARDVAGRGRTASSMLRQTGTDHPRSGTAPLTPREAETLQLVADGLSTSEVAATLFISTKTVKNHLASAYAKLAAHDRTQAVLAAVKSGIVRLR